MSPSIVFLIVSLMMEMVASEQITVSRTHCDSDTTPMKDDRRRNLFTGLEEDIYSREVFVCLHVAHETCLFVVSLLD